MVSWWYFCDGVMFAFCYGVMMAFCYGVMVTFCYDVMVTFCYEVSSCVSTQPVLLFSTYFRPVQRARWYMESRYLQLFDVRDSIQGWLWAFCGVSMSLRAFFFFLDNYHGIIAHKTRRLVQGNFFIPYHFMGGKTCAFRIGVACTTTVLNPCHIYLPRIRHNVPEALLAV